MKRKIVVAILSGLFTTPSWSQSEATNILTDIGTCEREMDRCKSDGPGSFENYVQKHFDQYIATTLDEKGRQDVIRYYLQLKHKVDYIRSLDVQNEITAAQDKHNDKMVDDVRAERMRTALNEALPAAKLGNAEAQYLLALIYSDDLGDGPEHVPKDSKEAIHWMKLSADQGYPYALEWMGYWYEVGKVVPKDLGQAVTLYRLALNARGKWGKTGTGNAEHGMANAYYFGYPGAEKDMGVSYGYLEKCALTWPTDNAKQCLAQMGAYFYAGIFPRLDRVAAYALYKAAGDDAVGVTDIAAKSYAKIKTEADKVRGNLLYQELAADLPQHKLPDWIRNPGETGE